MAKLLTPSEMAEVLNVSVETLRNYRRQGEGPPYVTLRPHTYRYPEDKLTAWLDAGGQVAQAESRLDALETSPQDRAHKGLASMESSLPHYAEHLTQAEVTERAAKREAGE